MSDDDSETTAGCAGAGLFFLLALACAWQILLAAVCAWEVAP